MLFNSYPFILVFLPLALAGFYLAGRAGAGAAALWLCLASIAFYAWWSAPATLLLAASVAGNYAVASAIRRSPGAKARRAWMWAGIVSDLAVLGYFKYADFFAAVATGQDIVHTVAIPLGISFYTFTQIAFLVDASGAAEGAVHPVRYSLFVTFFPHLIAGPLYHHAQIVPQFRAPAWTRFDLDNFNAGVAFFALGLFKKTVLADSLAPIATAYFSSAQHLDPTRMVDAWQGVLAYAFQIYFDFSGYSDMAIGLARMFNVRLPFNFDAPYKAESIIEFWRRWHMTLSAFLRDYLYVPLGGNRKGPARRYANLMVTMLLGGLWHGAAWTFIAWGAIHGFYLLVNHAWRSLMGPRNRTARPVARLASRALTFFAVTLAWIPFRAESLTTAKRVAEDLLALHPAPPSALPVDNALPIIAAMAIAWLLPTSQRYVDEMLPALTRSGAWKAGAVMGMLVFVAIKQLSGAPASPFLYFNF